VKVKNYMERNGKKDSKWKEIKKWKEKEIKGKKEKV
jgi:hypothetical protein